MSTLRTNAIVDNAGGNTATINGALAVNTTTLRTELNATGSAPIYACRAWVNFSGTGTVSIRASGNVSSITDNGVGNYTVNFTTAMPDANFCTAVASSRNAGDGYAGTTNNRTTSSVQVVTYQAANFTDFAEVSVAIFR